MLSVTLIVFITSITCITTQRLGSLRININLLNEYSINYFLLQTKVLSKYDLTMES